MIDEPGCPRCGKGNFPNMPGELCDECQKVLTKKKPKLKVSNMIGWVRWNATRLQLQTLGSSKHIVDTAKPTRADTNRHTHPRRKRKS